MYSIEAFWTIQAVCENDEAAAGTILFLKEKIYGGDHLYYYLGDYKVNNGILEAKMETIHFYGAPNSIFGPSERHELVFSGKIAPHEFLVKGMCPKFSNMEFTAKLSRVAGLPQNL